MHWGRVAANQDFSKGVELAGERFFVVEIFALVEYQAGNTNI
jgi:hypothetical protein